MSHSVLVSCAARSPVGRSLIDRNAERYAREADLRYSLVRVNEHIDAVALSAGEADEERRIELDLTAVLAQPYREAGQHLRASRRSALLPFALNGAQPDRDGRHIGRIGPLHLPGDRAIRGIVNGAGAGKFGGAGRGFGRLDGGHTGHRRRGTVTQVARPRQVSSLPAGR